MQSLSLLTVNNYCFRIQVIKKLPIVTPFDMTEVEERDIDIVETKNVLMVRTKNLIHDPFESTPKVKVSILDLCMDYTYLG